jgi:hypothetical protein
MQPMVSICGTVCLLLAAVLAGCAGGPPVDKTLQAEVTLGTAGFTMKSVTTQAQGEKLAKLPQRQVVRFATAKGEVYVWADIAECRCFYTGTRKNYETLYELNKEARGQQRINWYDAQDNDPLWGSSSDWEDALLGGG